MLEVLKKDLAGPSEIKFIVMSKRMKKQLSSKEQFGLALKLSGIIEEQILAYE